MARILIIGYGNPLRSDDGLGWRAATELSRKLSGEDSDILSCHQLTPELAAPVSTAEVVFFIDAAQNGEPGDIRCNTVVPETWNPRFSHDLSPGAILTLAQQLYGSFPPSFVVSLCGRCFEHGKTLSHEVQVSIPHLVALVEQMAGEVLHSKTRNATDTDGHLSAWTVT